MSAIREAIKELERNNARKALKILKDEQRAIVVRTKKGLEIARRQGKILGRPKGRSKLDDIEEQIREKLSIGIKQKRIAKDIGCTEATLSKWLCRKRKQWQQNEHMKISQKK